MTDKVQKIREEVEKIARSINPYIPDEEGKNSEYEAGRFAMVIQIMQIIDSMQEEPIPKFKVGDTIRNIDSGELFHIEKVDSRNYWDGRDSFYIIHQDCWELVEEPVSEELEDAASSFARKDSEGISNPANFYYTVADKARIFKVGAQWQKQQIIDKALDWAKARLTNRGYRDFKKYLENDDIQRHRHNTML